LKSLLSYCTTTKNPFMLWRKRRGRYVVRSSFILGKEYTLLLQLFWLRLFVGTCSSKVVPQAKDSQMIYFHLLIYLRDNLKASDDAEKNDEQGTWVHVDERERVLWDTSTATAISAGKNMIDRLKNIHSGRVRTNTAAHFMALHANANYQIYGQLIYARVRWGVGEYGCI
jgi:hypothetical protein